MWFLIKLSSLIVIIFTAYILGIFLMPSQTDILADKLWISEFNQSVRWLKTWADTVGNDMLQVKEGQSAVDMARNAMKSTQDSIQKWQEVVNKTQSEIENKIDQANKVVESGQKVIDSTRELKQNVSNLTSGTWVSK